MLGLDAPRRAQLLVRFPGLLQVDVEAALLPLFEYLEVRHTPHVAGARAGLCWRRVSAFSQGAAAGGCLSGTSGGRTVRPATQPHAPRTAPLQSVGMSGEQIAGCLAAERRYASPSMLPRLSEWPWEPAWWGLALLPTSLDAQLLCRAGSERLARRPAADALAPACSSFCTRPLLLQRRWWRSWQARACPGLTSSDSSAPGRGYASHRCHTLHAVARCLRAPLLSRRCDPLLRSLPPVQALGGSLPDWELKLDWLADHVGLTAKDAACECGAVQCSSPQARLRAPRASPAAAGRPGQARPSLHPLRHLGVTRLAGTEPSAAHVPPPPADLPMLLRRSLVGSTGPRIAFSMFHGRRVRAGRVALAQAVGCEPHATLGSLGPLPPAHPAPAPGSHPPSFSHSTHSLRCRLRWRNEETTGAPLPAAPSAPWSWPACSTPPWSAWRTRASPRRR